MDKFPLDPFLGIKLPILVRLRMYVKNRVNDSGMVVGIWSIDGYDRKEKVRKKWKKLSKVALKDNILFILFIDDFDWQRFCSVSPECQSLYQTLYDSSVAQN